MASKKLAEKAIWDLYYSEKPAWGLSVVCPMYIGGPCVLEIGDERVLSYRNSLLWKTAVRGGMPQLDLPS